MPKENDYYFLKMRLEASYIVQLPARDKEEALTTRYRHSIPLDSLYDVEKTVLKIMKMIENPARRKMPRFGEVDADDVSAPVSDKSSPKKRLQNKPQKRR